MEPDALVRTLAVLAAVAAAAAYGVGGLLTRVAGAWQDGTQRVTLAQLGPLVWGEALLPGGRQSYRGRAVFGRVRLARADHGEAHLRALGFDAQAWRAAEGRTTGHVDFVLRGGALAGTFTGRRFSVDAGRVHHVEAVAPVPRTWYRLAAPD